MSWQAVRWVLGNSEARLGARLVLLVIADHADQQGRNAYPSMSRIADQAHISERQVERVIPHLEELGELRVERRAVRTEGGRRVHRYALRKMALPDILTRDKSSGDGPPHPTSDGHDPTSTTATTRHPVRGNDPEPPFERTLSDEDRAQLRRVRRISSAT